MSKKNFNKSGKEKLAMLLTSALVVGACTVTGVYVNKMEKIEDDGYVVDLSELDEKTEGADMQSGQNMQEEAGNVNSDSVVNELPDTTLEKGAEPAKKKTEIPGVGYLEDLKEAEKAADIVEDAVSDKITEQLSAGSAAAMSGLETNADNTVLQFGIDDKMMWPISGDVILNYSMDKTIYFPTLDQYKYNPAIYISGQAGTEVSAAARGRVESVGTNEEIGQFIVMELGDGYKVTYGQLQNPTVKEGDIVAKGQVIASLSSPTKYNSLEGANLYFAATKDGTSINPMEYLQ